MRPRHFFKEWRQTAGLNQTQAALKLGLDRGYLCRVEKGKRPYNQPMVEAAAAIYGCTVAQLLTVDPDAVEDAEIQEKASKSKDNPKPKNKK